jgi:hypothetical protein
MEGSRTLFSPSKFSRLQEIISSKIIGYLGNAPSERFYSKGLGCRNILGAQTMGQVVSQRALTAATQVKSHFIRCRVCGRKCGTEA